MRSLVRWAVSNAPAMNVLMVTVMVVGGICTVSLNREVFPEFDLDTIVVSVPYPGASPDEVEEGICQKIEEAVRSVKGIKKITSTAMEGSGTVTVELESDVHDADRVLNEVRSEVDQISSFPVMSEDEEVRLMTIQETAIRVGVLGPPRRDADSDLQLREVAERVRDGLLLLPGVSDVQITGARDYQIDIEIPEQTLRAYGLSLRDVADVVRRENFELPGGTIRATSQEVLVRGHNRRVRGEEIAKLPLVTDPGGAVLTIGDLGVVRDEFTDTAALCEINGEPGLALSVIRNTTEDLLAVVDAVYDYVDSAELPEGYRLITWCDRSAEVRGRVQLLVANGLQGLLLVFLLLALFLDLRLAFWTAAAIPFCILGTGIYLYFTGQTLNMLSMFAFIMALGILVDDAIVVGENIHSHRESGKPAGKAAIDGTCEVAPAVSVSVLTTIIAFVPLLFVAGMMGKFISVLPVALIAILVLSLVECFTIFACHMAHEENGVFRLLDVVFYVFRPVISLLRWLNVRAGRGLEWFVARVYRPTLTRAVANRWVVISGALGALIVSVGLVRAGVVPFMLMRKIDSANLVASVAFPDGTPGRVTDRWTREIEEAFWRVNDEFAKDGSPLAVNTCRVVGTQVAGRPGTTEIKGVSHKGSVEVELVPSERRNVHSQEVLSMWRAEVGSVPGADSVTFDTMYAPPTGTAVEFKLIAAPRYEEQLEEAVARAKAKLGEFPGVFDVADDSVPGKWEYRVRVKDEAKALGVRTADLAETVRATYYGDEVMRVQRGRHEVKIMVRYPREDRHTLAQFNEIRVRTGDGAERPLTEMAEVDVVRGYSTIHRRDQKRAVTVSADVEEGAGNAHQIVAAMQSDFMPKLLGEFPEVGVVWEGQQEREEESLSSLFFGLGVALLAIFVLLAVEFKSYFQPLIILAIVPFGMIGAILGHGVQGHPLELFSVLGIVALSGIVINDSIVLIDFVNRLLASGMGVAEAVIEAGCRRLRPVLLTSVTTASGLMPLLFERSRQAQMLIPMATSIVFGVMVCAVLVLCLVPVFYSLYASACRRGRAEAEADEASSLREPAALHAAQDAPLRGDGQPGQPVASGV